ncbi:hypothetical protein niasHT_028003 [Heterodera trifolii]|uniref:Secreted protein n=1 Tax=Heterodera trifolii TaxID=157864 RepID=A0ABD2KEL1_9BILA
MFFPSFSLLLFCSNFLLLPILTYSKEACDGAQFAQMPCRCCKMDCWYSVAGSAMHQLGHVPGEAGEREALATLRLIRACMIAECTPLCAHNLMQKRMPKQN